MKTAKAYAPANIALSKYWGKRDLSLNLPTNGSLSLSLGKLGTTTEITTAESDAIFLNGKLMDQESIFSQKIWRFIDRIQPERTEALVINTQNTIPTAAGLASSASGFAALALALNQYFELSLNDRQLSLLARQGSGSACRSLWHGFVKWQKGEKQDGTDSYAYPMQSDWQELRFAVIDICRQEKKISSTEGMNRTMRSSPLFKAWVDQAEIDLIHIEQAIINKDFTQLGEFVEANAMMMHASMIAARPSICYWQAESVSMLEYIQAQRKKGLEIYATMDAGPNIKIIYHVKDQIAVENAFTKATYINPFEGL